MSAQIWPNHLIEVAARKWAAERGCSPTAEDWLRAERGHPGKTIVYRRYGSWSRFLSTCGLPQRRAGGWTRDRIVFAFTRFRFEHGRLPRHTDWTYERDGYPNRYQVEALFGSWNGAVIAAGYEPLKSYRSKQSYRASIAAATKAAA